MIAIINGSVITMEGTDYHRGTVLMEGDKIVAVGTDIVVPTGAKVYDAQGKTVMPGLIDAHCHVGIYQDLLSIEEQREDMDDCIMPQLRTMDAINPAVYSFGAARGGGVTTLAISPGSGHVVGGQVAVVKSVGKLVDDMILREPAALKVALGEIFCHRGVRWEPTPQARMLVVASLRDAFIQAENYEREDRITDLGLEILLQAEKGRIPVYAHAQRADDIMTAIRLAKEFSLDLVLVHATEALAATKHILKNDIPVIIGPQIGEGSGDLADLDWAIPGQLEQEGVRVMLCSNHPAVSVEGLLQMAAYAHQAGMSRDGALRAVTTAPAEVLHIEDEVGSLAEDKDADVIVVNGDPLSPDAVVEQVFINGEQVK